MGNSCRSRRRARPARRSSSDQYSRSPCRSLNAARCRRSRGRLMNLEPSSGMDGENTGFRIRASAWRVRRSAGLDRNQGDRRELTRPKADLDAPPRVPAAPGYRNHPCCGPTVAPCDAGQNKLTSNVASHNGFPDERMSPGPRCSTFLKSFADNGGCDFVRALTPRGLILVVLIVDERLPDWLSGFHHDHTH